MGVGEGADEGVGEDDAAHQVVGEAVLDGDTEGLLEEDPPGLLVVHRAPQLLTGGQRLGEGGEHPAGDPAGQVVEVLPGPVLAVGAGEPDERLAGALLAAADEQAGG